MALIACWECDSKISTEAELCPQCGAPSKDEKLIAKAQKAVPQAMGIDPEIHHEMLAQANIVVKRKKLLKSLQKINAGKVLEKFLHAKGEGAKVYAQVIWKHYSIDDHEKDKTIQTHVSQNTGTTTRGTSYVKDVNVSTTTTHYDYVNVLDTAEKKSTFRLVDCSLDKLKAGQVISLGWVQRSDSSLTDDKPSTESWDIGQQWSEVTQPSIFVSHLDPKAGSESQWQALSATKFKESFIKSGIGWWHLLWLTPLILGGSDMQVGASIIALSVMAAVKFSRSRKADKQFKLFQRWYRDEVDLMLKKGNTNYRQLG